MTYSHVQVSMGYTLTAEAFERAAKALAEAINGGEWERDYTPAQKTLWRDRLDRGLRAT
jgi:uncharacterized membrane protein